jgi:DMSO/TMAO reductase YedYZ heme-binding membrane subunit
MRGMYLTWTLIVVTVMLLLAAWLKFLLREVPREVDKGLGIAFAIFGVFNLLLYRRHARMFLKLGSKSPFGIVNALGISGLRFLFLGIAVLLVVMGMALWIRGA